MKVNVNPLYIGKMMRMDKNIQMISEKMEPGCYGEWVFYEDEDEKLLAMQYLNLWRIFMLKKLKGLKQFGDESIIDRQNIQPCSLLVDLNEGSIVNTLGIKIQMVAV